MIVRLAVVVSSRYERAVGNGELTRKHTQAVVDELNSRSHRPLEEEPRSRFSSYQESRDERVPWVAHEKGWWGGILICCLPLLF